MTSQLNYLIVQQRHIEFAYRAEQARLADQARAARSTFSPRHYVRRLRATHWLQARHPAAAAGNTTAVSLRGDLRCDT